MQIERVKFTHKLLQKSIPEEIYISKLKYDQCKNHCNECDKKLNWGKYRLENDIFFDVFYWLKTNSQFNSHCKIYTKMDLCEDYTVKGDDNDFLNIAREIGIVALYELCLYHAVWNHYWTWHYNRTGFFPSVMKDWDSMLQSKHILSKYKLNYLIYLLLSDPERMKLMKEIRDFSFSPPFQSGAVSGYKYKKLNLGWQSRFSRE